MLVALVNPKPGDYVLDLCTLPGKLHMACMGNKGNIILQICTHRLKLLKKQWNNRILKLSGRRNWTEGAFLP